MCKILEHDPIQRVAEVVFLTVAGHDLGHDLVGIELLRLDDRLADRHLRGKASERADLGQDGLQMNIPAAPHLLRYEHGGDSAAGGLALRIDGQHRRGPAGESGSRGGEMSDGGVLSVEQASRFVTLRKDERGRLLARSALWIFPTPQPM